MKDSSVDVPTKRIEAIRKRIIKLNEYLEDKLVVKIVGEAKLREAIKKAVEEIAQIKRKNCIKD